MYEWLMYIQHTEQTVLTHYDQCEPTWNLEISYERIFSTEIRLHFLQTLQQEYYNRKPGYLF
jgi:hypothetical protein